LGNKKITVAATSVAKHSVLSRKSRKEMFFFTQCFILLSFKEVNSKHPVTFTTIRTFNNVRGCYFRAGLSEKAGRLQPSLRIPAPTLEATSLLYANTSNSLFCSLRDLPPVECR
jgi:hypothetical protein